jgi:hypothetical protein
MQDDKERTWARVSRVQGCELATCTLRATACSSVIMTALYFVILSRDATWAAHQHMHARARELGRCALGGVM